MQPQPFLFRMARDLRKRSASHAGIADSLAPDAAGSRENRRGGSFAATPSRLAGPDLDLFRPFRALYFGGPKPRVTHWPSLARPVGRYLVRKIP